MLLKPVKVLKYNLEFMF